MAEAKPYRFLRISVVVFKVLAWVSVVFQVVSGAILLVAGGEPLLIAGIDFPARLVGLLNFLAAAVYFFSFWLMSTLIRLLLDVRERLGTS